MTYERWESLLRRAWAEGVRCEPHPTKPSHALCSSSRHAHVRYTVNAYRCNCPTRDACKHRALFLFERPDLLPLVVEPIETEHDVVERLLDVLGDVSA
jgi:hypothetical protein